MAHISDIKLIRTDTTLDLSQKAEKGMLCKDLQFAIYKPLYLASCVSSTMWDTNKSFGSLAFFDYLTKLPIRSSTCFLFSALKSKPLISQSFLFTAVIEKSRDSPERNCR